MNNLVVFDGNAVLHRTFHALPPLTTRDGEPINAVYGMVSMLLRVLEEFNPKYIAFTFDRPEPTFRKKEYDRYQSHRPPTEEKLLSQFGKAKDVLTAMGIPFYEKAGFEADDIIGTIAKKATEKNTTGVGEVIIVTGDRDQLQLVNDKVHVYMPVSGVTRGKIFTPGDVTEKMGVKPSQIVDYKALVGDPSDNYPGVPGIGPKSAVTLLAKYGSFTNIYTNIGEIGEAIKSKLINGKESGDLSYKLAKIIEDVPLPIEFSHMAEWKLASEELLGLFRQYGFNTLTTKVITAFKKTTGDKPVDELNAEISSSLTGSPARKSGEDFINHGFEKAGTGSVSSYKTKLSKQEIENVVLKINKFLKGKNFAIRGTAGMVLQGIDMGVTDIDILCDGKSAVSVNKIFAKELVQKVVYSESEKFKSYFGKFSIDNVLVEVMGEWQINKTQNEKLKVKNWSEIYNAGKEQIIYVRVRGTKIPVIKLEIELKCSAEMGRWNEFHKIKKQIGDKSQQSLF